MAQAILASSFYKQFDTWDYTVTSSTPVLQTSAPGKILAGGDMTLTVGGGTNDMSQILAGGALRVQGGTIANKAVEVDDTTTTQGRLITFDIRSHTFSSDTRYYYVENYSPVTPSTTVTLTAARQEGGQNATSGSAPGASTPVSAQANTSAAGAVGTGRTVNPIIEVASTVSGSTGVSGASANANGLPASTGQSLVVRTSTPDASVPTASLFRTVSGSLGYLVETDPAFINYRSWLGSDYLLNALGSDPATTQKRLGDGFYEQRLIREQVAQLTGYRYLEGFQSDEAQYKALMDAGVTFAKAYQLTPGIALTAAQMAQLTSDIVWLVEQTVTLADGSTQKVLVPQVYVRVRPGDIDGSGALLSADALTIKNEAGQGDVINSGTIAGRSMVSITADNVQNLGGRITGGSVGVNARTDLNNLGGTIDAQNAVTLKAGRDINIASTTRTAVGTQGSSTQLDRVAGVYVTNLGGTLVASAGHDVNLIGAILSNAGAGGLTSVKAGNDINLGTVKTASSQDNTRNANNYRRSSESAEVGSTITADGTTVLSAGNDVNIRQGTVDAGSGLLSVHAERDINISAGQSTQSFDAARKAKDKGFLSSKTTTSRNTLDESISQGSSLSGGIVSVTAGRDIVGEGVKIRGDDGVLVQAGGVLDLHEARDIRSESNSVSVKKSGFGLGGGSIPVVVPKKNASRDSGTTYSNTAAVTSIESKNGGVLLQGDQLVALQGVQVDAAKDVTIRGGSVSISGAVNETSSTSEHYQKDLNLGTETWWRDPGTGINAKRTDTDQLQQTSLVRSTLNGANVNISATGAGAEGEGGTLLIAGTTINTPGILTLEADKLILGTQTTQTDTSSTSEGRDVMWQKAKGEGKSDETTNYNQFNAGHIATNVNSVQAGLGAKDSIQSLAQQPGMAWVNQINNDPKLAGKVDWVKVEEAHTQWDYKQQGLTPEGAAIVTLVAAYFAYPAAQAAGASAGAAVGGGSATFVTGAVTAGVTTLASQAAVAIINNRGNLGDALEELGSSENVKGLLTAIITGGYHAGTPRSTRRTSSCTAEATTRWGPSLSMRTRSTSGPKAC